MLPRPLNNNIDTSKVNFESCMVLFRKIALRCKVIVSHGLVRWLLDQLSLYYIRKQHRGLNKH